ncbi:MAG: hypothetical protein JXB49_18890 [Bacteroidales bacterium]|nr:hypothetical protein [Bacteroidales bacterium]
MFVNRKKIRRFSSKIFKNLLRAMKFKENFIGPPVSCLVFPELKEQRNNHLSGKGLKDIYNGFFTFMEDVSLN